MEAEAYVGQGNNAKAEELLSLVANFQPEHSYFGSGNLLTALALRELGKESEADRMVVSWTTDFSENRIAQWCAAIYRGEKEKATGILGSRNDQADTTPWETSSRDPNFDLIVRLF